MLGTVFLCKVDFCTLYYTSESALSLTGIFLTVLKYLTVFPYSNILIASSIKGCTNIEIITYVERLCQYAINSFPDMKQ